MSKFSQRLKELRTSHKITQEELATSLQLGGKQIISSYEGNSKPTEPSIDTLMQIAKYFGVTVDYLIGNSNQKNHGLMALNDKIKSLGSFIEQFADWEPINENLTTFLDIFLQLNLRHLPKSPKLLEPYIEILRIITEHDAILHEAYSSSDKYEHDGSSLTHEVNQIYINILRSTVESNFDISKKELEADHKIAEQLQLANKLYCLEKGFNFIVANSIRNGD